MSPCCKELASNRATPFGLNIMLTAGEGCYVYQEHSSVVLGGFFSPWGLV